MLSLFDDLNKKAYYIDVLSLSGVIYNNNNNNNNNNNSFLEYENINNDINIINNEIITLSSTIYNNYKNTIATS